MSTASTAPVLVVGVGSEVRRDDAVGRRVAEAVAARGLSGVEVRTVHQLVPELVETFAGRRRVVFVDASVSDREVAVRTLTAGSDDRAMSHHLDPAGLLALARILGSEPAEAVVISIPVTDLGVGTGLSPATTVAADVAVRRLIEVCRLVDQPPLP